ncbi:MAG TPA: hypothetical protein VFS08_13490 [Gemmatimonadaceae bacterium]|nr:hypothetical protein [Gemmatimonadaceae bacterium]
MFESIREALRDLWHGSRTPEERREVLAQMRETLVRARLGVEDLQAGLSATRVKLAEERRELDTVRRRRQLAERIQDRETVSVAERFERQHEERVAVLERKLEAQEAELALVERELAEMTREFKAAHAGIDPAAVGGRTAAQAEQARRAEAEQELDAALGGRDPARDPLNAELDSLRRATERQSREAQAEELLRALKQRMGGQG